MAKVVGLYLRLRVSSLRWFWQTRNWGRRAEFAAFRWYFHQRLAIGETLLTAGILRGLTRASALRIAAAVVVGFLVFWGGVLLTTGMASLSNLLGGIAGMVTGSIPQSGASAYQGALVGAITIAGLFLTLYLTNTAALAGSVYGSVSSRMRAIYLRERVSNVYVGLLIFVVVVSSTTLVLSLVFETRPFVSLTFVGVLGLLAIGAFVDLNQRTLQYFDPTHLAGTVVWEFGRWADLACAGSFRWRDGSFQAYYRKQAEASISGLEDLVAYCLTGERFQVEPIVRLIEHVSVLCGRYLTMRGKIPTQSQWYPKVPDFKSWYMTTSHEVELAMATGTDLQPRMIADTNWVERKVIRAQVETLRSLLHQGKTAAAIRTMVTLQKVLAALAFEWDVQYAVSEFNGVVAALKQSLSPISFESGRVVENREVLQEKLGIVEYLALVPVQMLVRFRERVESIDLEQLARAIETMDWAREDGPYSLGLPLTVVGAVEDLQRRIRFEFAAEGRPVTPPWYVRQVLAATMRNKILDEYQALTAMYRGVFGEEVWGEEPPGLPYSLEVTSRGLEFGHKAASTCSLLEDFFKKLDAWRVEESIGWATPDWGAMRLAAEDFIAGIYGRYAKAIPRLTGLSGSKSTPDYFGRAVHTAGEDCFGALEKNDPDRFGRRFPPYFLGILQEYEVLRKATSGWLPESALPVFTQPLLDLCDLSGYAMFFSELHGEPRLWLTCKERWDTYFAGDKGEAQLGLLTAIIGYMNQRFLITDGALLRARWKMRVNRITSNLSRKRGVVRIRRALPHYREIVDHPSRLVRAIAGSGDYPSLYQGEDIFVDLYLRTLFPGSEVDFGRDRGLADALSRLPVDEKDKDDAPLGEA